VEESEKVSEMLGFMVVVVEEDILMSGLMKKGFVVWEG